MENEEKEVVITRIEIKTKEEEKNFKLHIDWWVQLAKDTNKTLILEARLK